MNPRDESFFSQSSCTNAEQVDNLPYVFVGVTMQIDNLTLIFLIALIPLIVIALFALRWWRRRGSSFVVWSSSGEPYATLVVEQSDNIPAGRHYDLTKPITTLGRSTTSDIVLPDRPVSRTHAELREVDGTLYVFEVKSEEDGKMKTPRYGTFVNDVPVPANGRALKHGDKLRLGSRIVLRVERPDKDRADVTLDVLTEDRTFDQVPSSAAKPALDSTRAYDDSIKRKPAAPKPVDDATRSVVDVTREYKDTTRSLPDQTVPPPVANDQTVTPSSPTRPASSKKDEKTQPAPRKDEPPADSTRQIK